MNSASVSKTFLAALKHRFIPVILLSALLVLTNVGIVRASAVPDSLEAQAAAVVEPIPAYAGQPATVEELSFSIDMLDSLVLHLERNLFPIVPTSDTVIRLPVEDLPKPSPELYTERLRRIPTSIPLQYNDKVRSFIEVYTVRGRGGMIKMLGLSQLYFPLIEEALDRRQLPMELKYMAVIESALNQHAVSRRGATGLWQMMYRTGRGLGLRIDTYVDERRDPYLATEAALDYLEQLHGIYDDWMLAIAAYNCGPGNVNKAIRLSGGKRNVWEVYPWLPRETRGYVPGFIAATYAFTYYEEHLLQAQQPIYHYELTDTVTFTHNMALAQLADSLDMSEEELYFYNPSLRRKYIPGRSSPYPLRLPFEQVGNYLISLDCIVEAAESAEQAPTVTVASRTSSSSPPAAAYFKPEGMSKLTYTVKSGDNLGFISEWYDCRVNDLRLWNGLSGNRIRIGQKIAIYKKGNEVKRYEGISTMSFADKQARIGKAPTSDLEAGAGNGYFWYEVRSGDNLWDIARRNPGNSIETITRLNDMNAQTKLKPGMKLKLQK